MAAVTAAMSAAMSAAASNMPASAVASATRATVTTSSTGWHEPGNSSEPAEKEYRRWEHRAIQSIQ